MRSSPAAGPAWEPTCAAAGPPPFRVAVGKVAFPGQELPHHRLAGLGDAALEAAFGAHAGVAAGTGLLVHPVGGDAMLGMFVHGPGAHLHLDRAPIVPQHHRMQ